MMTGSFVYLHATNYQSRTQLFKVTVKKRVQVFMAHSVGRCCNVTECDTEE